MQNITLFALLLIVTLASCKKDKVENPADTIQGRWKVEAVIFLQYKNGAEVDRDEQSLPNQFFDFRPDGSALVNLDGEDVEVRWTATGFVLQLHAKENYTLDMNIKSLSKNNLSLTYDTGVEVENNVTTKEMVEFQMRKVN